MARNVLLIAVPDADTRRRFNQALERTPHHLVFALSSDEAFERFAEVKPDLLIAATMAPRIAGGALVDALREAPRGEDVPMVLYGRGGPTSPADAVLDEVFERRELLSMMAPLLAYGRPETESADIELASVDVDVGAAAQEEISTGIDAQTVVGFPNPFFEGDAEAPPVREEPTPVGRPNVSGEPPTDTGVAEIQPGLGEANPPTPVGRLPGEAPERETEVRMVASAPAAPSTSSAPSSSPELVAPVPDSALTSPRDLDESQLGRRLAERVERLHEALDGIDYYQLLGVEASADESRIHSAWFDLSLELHPDRFFLLRDAALKEKIYVVYRRVTEAHRVLGDPARRAEYDHARKDQATTRAPEALRASSPDLARTAGLELQADNASARSFADRAEAAFARDALQEARFQLHAMLACEGESLSARRALAVIEARLGASV